LPFDERPPFFLPPPWAVSLGTSGLRAERSGKISASHPMNSAPVSLVFALSGNIPSSGGGAPGIPPKYATALQIWSTTVMGLMLLSSVSRRACSYFVSSGASGLARCLWSSRDTANGEPRFAAGSPRLASNPLFFGGTYFSDCAAFAREAVFSLVRLAAASRSAAASRP
jgi:hypothetical protein